MFGEDLVGVPLESLWSLYGIPHEELLDVKSLPHQQKFTSKRQQVFEEKIFLRVFLEKTSRISIRLTLRFIAASHPH